MQAKPRQREATYLVAIACGRLIKPCESVHSYVLSLANNMVQGRRGEGGGGMGGLKKENENLKRGKNMQLVCTNGRHLTWCVGFKGRWPVG